MEGGEGGGEKVHRMRCGRKLASLRWQGQSCVLQCFADSGHCEGRWARQLMCVC
jgi:hypothetical protein